MAERRLDAGKGAVTEHQHAWLQGAQQRRSQALFTAAAGSQDSIDDGRGPSFSQGEAAHLGKGTGTLARGQPPEMETMGRRVGDFIQGAIDGHEPQSKAEGAFGLLAGHGLTLATKEQTQDGDA